MAAHPAPWLAASVAAFGVVVGMSTYGGTAVQNDFDNLMRTEVVSSSALKELSTGVLDLHDALHGALVGTSATAPDEIQAQLDTLDAAFSRYRLMPASDDERLEAQAAEAAYLAWRKEVVVPALTALREGGQLVTPEAGGEFQRGIIANTMTSRHLTELSKTNREHGNASLTQGFREFDQRSATLLLSGVAGITAGLAAGFTAVARAVREGKRALLLEGLEPMPAPRHPVRAAARALVPSRGSTTAASNPVSTFAFDDGGYAGYPLMAAPGGGQQPLLFPVPFSLIPQRGREPATAPAKVER